MQERLGIEDSKVMINIERYGNTTAGTIPLGLRDAVAQGRLKKGDLVMLVAVGAGFTTGGMLLRRASSNSAAGSGSFPVKPTSQDLVIH